MNNDLAFRSILTFVSDLNAEFGETHKPLRFYNHLLEKTTFSHTAAIQKHIDLFSEFSCQNRDALNKPIGELPFPRVQFSEKVYIDVGALLQEASDETAGVIWQHLLTISAVMDPAGNAKVMLSAMKTAMVERAPSGLGQILGGGGKSGHSLDSIVEKLQGHVQPNSNPAEVISSLMSSGVFTELVTSLTQDMQSGKLDIKSLLQEVMPK